MCGRYSLTADERQIQTRFMAHSIPAVQTARYNIAPTQPVWALVHAQGLRIVMLRWGLIPSWAKDKALGNRMINARAEGIAEKSSFRRAIRKQRCLVLADGFYEWKKTRLSKVPYYIRLKSGEPFGFAGLWERWVGPSGETVHSCTIITTTPNELMADIHPRMPVVVPREAEERWLDPTGEDPQEVLPLLQPYPADEMEAYAVSTVVNSPRNDVVACIEPTGGDSF